MALSAFLAFLMQLLSPNVWFVAHRHTLEELEQLVETAKQAVPNVDAAIAAAIDRKVNPVSLGPTTICCSSVGSKQD
jgi:hypothetical protein